MTLRVPCLFCVYSKLNKNTLAMQSDYRAVGIGVGLLIGGKGTHDAEGPPSRG
jgi:hypothetical protein